MTINSITSFIENNSSDEYENNLPPFANEYETVLDILSQKNITAQISNCLEDLKTKVARQTLKSTSESNKYREEGNRLFRSDKKANALAASRYYTNAILAAPAGSIALALGHANRAAALAEFGYYLDAYYDCELAVSLGYPKENQSKIIMRQAYCSVKLGSFSKLNSTLESLKNMILSKELVKKREEYEKELINFSNQQTECLPECPDDYKVQNISLQPEKGRHLTACRDYQKNDVILTETAFALVPVNNAKICYNCGKDQIIPYPCYTCSIVVYCSLHCKNVHKRIHDYECYGYRCDFFEAIGITHMALNTTISGLPQIISELNHCTSGEQIWKQIEIITKSRRNGYPEILSLYNNVNTLNSKSSRLLALTAILAANYLVHLTQFLNVLASNPCHPDEWLGVLSALIFRHAVQMIVNAQSNVSVFFSNKSYDFVALTDIWVKPQHLKKRLLHKFRGIDVSFAAIYPYLSLCNHSCEPSLMLNFDGRRVIAKAQHELKKGDEIFNSYVLDYRCNSRKNRRDELKEIHQFECDCRHCSPLNQDDEYLRFHKYRCGNKICNNLFSPPDNAIRWWLEIGTENAVIKCPLCQTTVDVEWYIEFDELFKSFNVAKLTTAFKLFEYSDVIACGFSELRHHMAWNIVTTFFEMWKENVVVPEKVFVEIEKILKYLLDHVEQQNDVESIVYAVTSTFALDLMAEGKCFDLDRTKIRKSFDTLTTELKIIFENYVKDYIGEKFEDEPRMN